MRYAEIISEIEIGGGVDSNLLKPFPKFEPKFAEPRQLEMFKEFPPLTTNAVTNAGYKPLGRIGKYTIAEQVKYIPNTGFGFNHRNNGERTFLLFDGEGLCVGIIAVTEPDAEDGSGYRPARNIYSAVNGTGYRVSTVKIDPAHTGQMLAAQCYFFLLTHVCDFLMADTMQTSGGAAIWRKMLNSKKFVVLVYDDRSLTVRKRWAGKDFNQVYNNYFLHPIVTLPSKVNRILNI
jgi:hypothetical protein